MPHRYDLKQKDLTQFGQTATLTLSSENVTWAHSGRDGRGKLVLQANAFSRERERLLSFEPRDGNGMYLLPKGGTNPTAMLGSRGLTAAYNRALSESYARLRGKLYKGSGALGVTAASYRQSADMIRNRSNQLLGRADYWDKQLREQRRYGINNPRREAKILAGLHLEVIFGWMPLFEDILAAATTVIQLAIPPVWVSARAEFEKPFVFSDGSFGCSYRGNYKGHVKRAGSVQINNLNTWLAERAGILNAGSVAWDLVPWSFLVNQVANTGQLVSSITDYAGLSFANGSTTKSCSSSYSCVARYTGPPLETYGSSSYECSEKYTTPGAVNRPPLVLKLPDVNWGTASMLCSLIVQKTLKIPPRAR